jgi:hypothetical protein
MPEGMPNQLPIIPEGLLWAMGRQSNQMEPLFLEPEKKIISGVIVNNGVITFHAIHKYIYRPDVIPLSKGPFNPNKN